MEQSKWEEKIKLIQGLILKPIIFNDLCITLIDALEANHDEDWEVETHLHPWFEFNFVSEGAHYTTIQDEEFLISEGSSFIIPPGVYHSHRHCNHQGDDGFCLRWKLDVVQLPEHLRNNCSAAVISNAMTLPRILRNKVEVKALIENIIADDNEVKLQGDFIQWLIMLAGFWSDKERILRNSISHENIVTQQVLLYLSEYYHKPLTVNDVANSLNFSYRHLSRIFKQTTGMTIIEKLNEIRMNTAEMLLKNSDLTVKEIALKVGYENEYYFSTLFNQYYSTAPTRFRNKYRSSQGALKTQF